MNSLNSVLIEGDVLTRVLDADSGVLMLQIQSKRFTKSRDEDGECIVKELLKVNAIATGKLAENVNRNLAAGSRVPGVRVVGRLSEFLDMGLVVYAEHIEIKPVKE